jgi:hypothetical protein
MYYTVYKTTNVVNGKIYIGCHKTTNIDDDYVGSGKLLKRAINKYGIENFQKEILGVFDSPEEMFNMEAQLVNEDFVNETTNYNLKVGGEGGFDYINNNLDDILSKDDRVKRARMGREAANTRGSHLKGSQRHQQLMKEDPDYRAWYRERCEQSKPSQGTFTGKRHTEEAKRKISEANSNRFKGSKNPNYGKCWVYNEELQQSKSIPVEELDEYTNAGWNKGRKIKFYS